MDPLVKWGALGGKPHRSPFLCLRSTSPACLRLAELCAGESSARLWTRHFLPVSLGPEVWGWAWALATWGIGAAPAWATR